MRGGAIVRTRCRFKNIEPPGPKSRKMKETSSRGRAVSPCKRLSLIAGTIGPVKQPAKDGGVNRREFEPAARPCARIATASRFLVADHICFAMRKVNFTSRLHARNLMALEGRADPSAPIRASATEDNRRAAPAGLQSLIES
ncbi:hypothetical protein NB311A_07448 [Nitrobacter sp. Nb-311A]|nr:hypothetical protein NB311A_07448 [Nitrobacter sp. Nb-311A]